MEGIAMMGGMGGMQSQTDETLEQKPCLCLSGEQLAYLKLDNIPVGAKLQFSAIATVKEVSEEAGESGGTSKEVCLEMENINLQPEQKTADAVMYPEMS